MSPEEVAAQLAEIRERVRARYAKSAPGLEGFELPELAGLHESRDLVEGKSATIGQVNPRPPGWKNDLIQALKRLIARSLNWFIRGQVEFNQALLVYLDRNLDVIQRQNQALLRLGREAAELRALADRVERLQMEQADLVDNWKQWKPAFEERLSKTEVYFLDAVRDLEARGTQREEAFRRDWRKLHDDYRKELVLASERIQKQLWSDLERLKADQEKMIHSELRLLRRRTAIAAQPAVTESAERAAAPRPDARPAATAADGFDYASFEERFRGDEAWVKRNLAAYADYFAGCRRVIDLGCGRGELLALLAERGLDVQGVDVDPEALAACREKGLDVVQADLFSYLGELPEASVDGVACTHVVEHLAPSQLPRLAAAVERALKPGGLFVVESPNPRCLAIFAGDFYLDPTHQRPVPPALLDFVLREAGFGEIETIERNPATEVFPELAALDADERLRPFRERFFGGLDYAIIARKLKN